MNITVTVPGLIEFLGDIRGRLSRIEAQLRSIRMSQQEILDKIALINDATTAEADAIALNAAAIDAVGTKLQELRDQIAAGGDLSAIDSALGNVITTIGNTKVSLDGATSRLTAMAQDPANPVPVPTPPTE